MKKDKLCTVSEKGILVMENPINLMEYLEVATKIFNKTLEL